MKVGAFEQHVGVLHTLEQGEVICGRMPCFRVEAYAVSPL